MTDEHSEAFRRAANDPETWISSGRGLLASASALIMAYYGPHKATARTGRTIGPALMLRGFALENFFRAMWLRRGNRFAVHDRKMRLELDQFFRRHSVSKLALKLGLICAQEQVMMIVRLEHWLRSFGRYPLSLSVRDHGFFRGPEGQQLTGGFWQPEFDEPAFLAVLRAIETQLGVDDLSSLNVQILGPNEPVTPSRHPNWRAVQSDETIDGETGPHP